MKVPYLFTFFSSNREKNILGEGRSPHPDWFYLIPLLPYVEFIVIFRLFFVFLKSLLLFHAYLHNKDLLFSHQSLKSFIFLSCFSLLIEKKSLKGFVTSSHLVFVDSWLPQVKVTGMISLFVYFPQVFTIIPMYSTAYALFFFIQSLKSSI